MRWRYFKLKTKHPNVLYTPKTSIFQVSDLTESLPSETSQSYGTNECKFEEQLL